MSDVSLIQANQSIRKGARISVIVIPVACAAIIGSAVYNHRSLGLAILLAALVALAFILSIRRFSRMRFTEGGIERVGEPLIPWSTIVEVEPLYRRGLGSRNLHLDTGEVISLSIMWASSRSDIDDALKKHAIKDAPHAHPVGPRKASHMRTQSRQVALLLMLIALVAGYYWLFSPRQAVRRRYGALRECLPQAEVGLCLRVGQGWDSLQALCVSSEMQTSRLREERDLTISEVLEGRCFKDQ